MCSFLASRSSGSGRRDMPELRLARKLHITIPDRAVADVVITVAAEILGRKLPVARHEPFLDAAQDFGAAVAAVPAVERLVEIAGEIAEILAQRRRRLVPGGPDRALVDADLRDLDEAPLRAVEGR